MPIDSKSTRRRLLTVLVLTLLPWPAVWFGLYHLDNLVWTFALYHGVCLLPAIIWGKPLWRRALRWPNAGEWVRLIVVTAIVVPASVGVYHWIGATFINSNNVLNVVTQRGFRTQMLLPLALYFVPVNAALEELFWRGVVLNELNGMGETAWTIGAAWTALTFATWHYLVIRLLLRPGWAEITVLGILAAGFYLAWLYRSSKSIIVPIFWHALVFDLPLMVIFAAVLRA